MQKAQNAFASASHHGLREEGADYLRKATGAIDKPFLTQQERIRDGLFRDRSDPSVCYTKGWIGWGKTSCSPYKKELDAFDASKSNPVTPAGYADPRYQGGRRKTRGKKSKKSKKSKKTRRY